MNVCSELYDKNPELLEKGKIAMATVFLTFYRNQLETVHAILFLRYSSQLEVVTDAKCQARLT